jgi:nicotinate-nucleotide pyrophosphorylase (carboxylating)
MNSPSPLIFDPLIRTALAEDLGRAGDITTDAIVLSSARVAAAVVARKDGRMSGGAVATRVFEMLDPSLEFEAAIADGDDFREGVELLRLRGPARAVLTGERTALNLLGHLCGVATLTRAFVEAVKGTGAVVVCTRKTTAGLRALEKYAVRCGGGSNHRFGLDDAVLIKDNHIAVAGSVAAAVGAARRAVGHLVKVELEVDSLAQLEEGLVAGVDALLLDNMEPDTLREAVMMVGGRCTTEASGGIDLTTVAAVAATGVDLISIGALTHSAPWLDLSLELRPAGS